MGGRRRGRVEGPRPTKSEGGGRKLFLVHIDTPLKCLVVGGSNIAKTSTVVKKSYIFQVAVAVQKAKICFTAMYIKGLYVLLSRSQAWPGRIV